MAIGERVKAILEKVVDFHLLGDGFKGDAFINEIHHPKPSVLSELGETASVNKPDTLTIEKSAAQTQRDINYLMGNSDTY